MTHGLNPRKKKYIIENNSAYAVRLENAGLLLIPPWQDLWFSRSRRDEAKEKFPGGQEVQKKMLEQVANFPGIHG
ncbi:MAG TPA: hypothetical protein VGB38_01430 [bacterium]